jgi:hypothetical protein
VKLHVSKFAKYEISFIFFLNLQIWRTDILLLISRVSADFSAKSRILQLKIAACNRIARTINSFPRSYWAWIVVLNINNIIRRTRWPQRRYFRPGYRRKNRFLELSNHQVWRGEEKRDPRKKSIPDLKINILWKMADSIPALAPTKFQESNFPPITFLNNRLRTVVEF